MSKKRTTRKHIPNATAARVLIQSRRRCCLCYYWRQNAEQKDAEQKAGQLAHIDRDRSNSAEDNLAYLCPEHHNEYDAQPSQTKKIMPDELRFARAQLYSYLKSDQHLAKVRLTIKLDGDFDAFDADEERRVMRIIRQSLHSGAEVRLVAKRPGSALLGLELDSTAALTLIDQIDSGRLAAIHPVGLLLDELDFAVSESTRKIPNYNHFEVFYGYSWASTLFKRDDLKEVMVAVQGECRRELSDRFGQDISVRVTDLNLKEGEFLPSQLRAQMERCCVGIFEISAQNPNVYYELGLMHGAGKSVLVVKERSFALPSDIEGIVPIIYEASSRESLVENVTSALCARIEEVRSGLKWADWLWDEMPEGDVNVFLGWTVDPFQKTKNGAPEHAEEALLPSADRANGQDRPHGGAGFLSTGDVQVMDELRQRLPVEGQRRLQLKVRQPDRITGEDLSTNIISIGGPRRNLCTHTLLGLPSISLRTRYELRADACEEDGYEPYYIRRKDGPKCEYRTTLRLEKPDPEKPETETGKDYGLIYKLTAPGGPPGYTWLILTGITRQGTLACLNCLFGDESLQKQMIDHSLASKDTEVLIESLVVKGGRMANPRVLDIHQIDRESEPR